jgi:hypothetical protein
VAYKHGKNTGVLLGKYNLSSYFNEVSANMSIETSETTTFTNAAKTYITSLNDGTISAAGLFDGDSNAVNAVLEEVISLDYQPVITIAYDGGFTAGNRCSMGLGEMTSYEVTAPVGDVVATSAEFQVTGGLRQGVLLAAQTAYTSATNGTSIDNSASTTGGYTGYLHVTTNSRSATTVAKIQHSADNSTWADLATFTTIAIGTLTSESISGSGTVNRYVRAVVTPAAGTGSITLSISFARRS